MLWRDSWEVVCAPLLGILEPLGLIHGKEICPDHLSRVPQRMHLYVETGQEL